MFDFVVIAAVWFGAAFLVAYFIGTTTRLRRDEQPWMDFLRGNEVHIFPKNDKVSHRFDDCPCQPVIIPTQKPNGNWIYRVIHYAQDGRKQII